jgi:hypothetical protein
MTAINLPHVQAVTEKLSLPLRQGLRRTSGNVQGSNAGSSIDFQDHRPYVPGDDPRHIDWQAYARSGNYTMKLYREEVRPLVDIVLDGSASMDLPDSKSLRTMELLHFCMQSCLRAGSALQIFSVSAETVNLCDHRVGEFPSGMNADDPPCLERVPWRQGSLRVLISDLLFPSDPRSLLRLMLGSAGRTIVFAPYCNEEEQPDWLGNTELLDPESGKRADHFFRNADMDDYARAYQAHFAMWNETARIHGIPLARVPSGLPFEDAITLEGLREGAVVLL